MKVLVSLVIGIAIISNASIAKEKNKLEISTMKNNILAADGKPPYGVFDVKASDGEVYREVILADGRFLSTAKSGALVEGVWEQREDGIFCSRAIKASKFRCKYEEVNSDGVWTSMEIEGGDISTIRRLKN